MRVAFIFVLFTVVHPCLELSTASINIYRMNKSLQLSTPFCYLICTVQIQVKRWISHTSLLFITLKSNFIFAIVKAAAVLFIVRGSHYVVRGL